MADIAPIQPAAGAVNVGRLQGWLKNVAALIKLLDPGGVERLLGVQ